MNVSSGNLLGSHPISYILFKDWTFLRITRISPTLMFLWIFVSLKPKLAVQLLIEKKENPKVDDTWTTRFIFTSQISGKNNEFNLIGK